MTHTFVESEFGIGVVLPNLEQAKHTLDSIVNHGHKSHPSQCPICRAQIYLNTTIQELRRIK